MNTIDSKKVGISLLLIGLWMLLCDWIYLYFTQSYFQKIALIGPVLIVLGADILIFKREFKKIPFRITHIPKTQLISLLIGLALGVLNLLQMDQPESFVRKIIG